MRKSHLWLPLVSIIVVLALITAGCAQPSPTPAAGKPAAGHAVTFTDSNGKNVTLPEAADRIVVTNSDCAEMLLAIGAGDEIVGITDSIRSNTVVGPHFAASVASVGNWQTPDVEKILSLKPDVIVCYSSSSKPKNIDQILAVNITVVYIDCFKMNNLSRDARSLGIMAGKEQQAGEYARFLDQYMNLVSSRVSTLASDKKPSVYWESYSAFSSVGKGAAGNTMIEMAGGNNLLKDNSTSYPVVSNEWVLSKNPNYIIKMANGTVNTTPKMASVYGELTGRPGMKTLAAVQNNKTCVMSGNIAFGPKGVVGLLYLAKILHPDLFKDVDPSQVQNEYAQKFLPGSSDGVFLYPAL